MTTGAAPHARTQWPRGSDCKRTCSRMQSSTGRHASRDVGTHSESYDHHVGVGHFLLPFQAKELNVACELLAQYIILLEARHGR